MAIIKISEEELAEILNKHDRWLHNEPGGEKANLSGLDLTFVNLSRRDLRYADLHGSDLRMAKLRFSNLRCADLRRALLDGAECYCADLSGANLSGAGLHGAQLYKTNLSNTDLSIADLSRVNFMSANLNEANLSNTTLDDADLTRADFSTAIFSKTTFSGANLDETILPEKEQIRKGLILKEDLIGYKKCRRNLIVELLIPKGSIIFSINNAKCRTNRAKVISIIDIEGQHHKMAESRQDSQFRYRLGAELEIEDFNLMYNVECATGIHFFRTKEEAINY